MIRYIVSFVVGIAVTYIGNFFYFTSTTANYSTGYYLANSLNTALPFLFTVIAIFVAGCFLVLFINWWNDKSAQKRLAAEEEANLIIISARRQASDIISDAHYQAQITGGNARDEARKLQRKAEAKYNNMVKLENELEQRRINLENSYQEKVSELEKCKQGYLEEIAGLHRKIEKLVAELRKTRQSGISKLRDQGKESAAIRTERKMERELSAYQ